MSSTRGTFRATAALSMALSMAPAMALAMFAANAPLDAAELHVAAAANFSGPLNQLAAQYQHSSGNRLVVSAGSSGQLYTQIKEGAPFDVFLSADTDKAQRLEHEGLAIPGSRFVYAIGSLVLWSPQAGAVDAEGRVLDGGHYRFIAIANPQSAPYGTAAQQVLRARNLWDKLNQDKKIVIGENITQTWQFVVTGNADMAFVALSQVIDANGTVEGSSWLVPKDLYGPIEQSAVALAHGAQPAAAQAFLRWLRTDTGALATVRAAGYRTPD